MQENKKDLIFITNIPTPYNFDLFESLSHYYSLKVYYYDKIESDRFWNLDINSIKYESFIFKKDILTYILNKLYDKLYFNIECLKMIASTKCKNIIISGVYFSPNTILIALIAKFRNKKIFWYGEKIDVNVTFSKFILKYILFSPIRYSVNGILAIGNVALKSYIKLGYIDTIYNTPYAINNEKFKRINHSYFDKSNKFTIVSSGSLIYRKGFDILLNAINSLDAETQKNLRVVILGDGPEKENLKKLTNKNYELILTGFIEPNEIYGYFKNSDLFVFTSRYDGWGVVVNEAIASSLPIIITNTCGASEYVDINGGFIINSDPQILKNRIKKLYDDVTLRLKMSKYNYFKAMEIDSDSIAKKISNII